MKILTLILFFLVYPIFSESKTASLESIYEGVVQDSETKKPIPNADIELKNIHPGVGYYIVKTDSSGKFVVKNFLPEIIYKLRIDAKGYVTYSDELRFDPTKKTKPFYLSKEGIVYGQVNDSKGNKITDVDIRLETNSDYKKYQSFETKSNLKAEYRFDKLKENSYFLEFKKTGYISETAVIKNVKAGTKFNLPMRLFKSSSISGTVLIKGLNIPSKDMYVVLSNPRVSHNSLTFPSGEFRIDDIKPGEYTLRISHRGFHEYLEEKIVVNEGVNIRRDSIQVQTKEPSLSVSANKYVFTPTDKITFDLKTFRIETIKVNIFELDDSSRDLFFNSDNNTKILTKNFKLVTSWEESVRDFTPFNTNYMQLEVKDKLPTASYLIQVTSTDSKYESFKVFSVTSIGILVKQSEKNIFVYATDLVSNEPITDSKVFIHYYLKKPQTKDAKSVNPIVKNTTDESNQEEDISLENANVSEEDKNTDEGEFVFLKEGKTNKDGFFFDTINFKDIKTNRFKVTAFAKDGSNAFSYTNYKSTENSSEVYKYILFTDRPVYRAKDTVNFKLLAKKREHNFIPILKEKGNLELRDPNQTIIFSKEMELDEWGSLNDKIVLDEDSISGRYDFTFETKYNQASVGHFYLEQYRKPEFKIDITPLDENYVNGEIAEFKVEAKYFFGAPLSNSMIEYKFYQEKVPDVNTKYWWEDETEETYSYRSVQLEGKKSLDVNGVAILKYDLKKLPYDRKITLEVRVIDKSNIEIVEEKSIMAGRGKFYIKIDPSKQFYSQNEKKSFLIQSLDFSGKGIQSEINLEFYRTIWKPWQRVYAREEKPVFVRKISTDKNGRFLLELDKELDVNGEIEVLATSIDSKQNKITASRGIWFYSEKELNSDAKLKNIELSLERNKIDKEEEITVFVKSKFKGNYICLSLEGKEIYETRLLKMEGNLLTTKIKLKSNYSPNLFITASLQKNKALYTATEEIEFPNQDTKLNIQVKANKETYLPREKVKLDIVVQNEQGKPMQTNLALSVVDESIYKIRRDHTPLLNPYFYTKISNWVSTSYSYPMTLLAGAGKEGSELLVRKNFKDTAYWQPDIFTDENGKGSLEFELPDNLTEWRLNLRGHDKLGRVGEKFSKILVSQDLVARIAKPRFFTEGDKIEISGIINNNSKEGITELKTEMKLDSNVLTPKIKQELSLVPLGNVKQDYVFTVPNKEKLKLTYKAISKSKQDALEHTIPVYKNGFEFKVSESGDLKKSSILELKPIQDTKNFQPIAEKIKISVNTSTLDKLFQANQYLVEFPYGCVEQTISRYLPSIALWSAKKNLFPNWENENKAEVDKIFDSFHKGVKRISQMQNDDGSFGWWSGDLGNEFLTAYALNSFIEIDRLGLKGRLSAEESNTYKKGLEAIKRMLSNPQPMSQDARIFLLYIYSNETNSEKLFWEKFPIQKLIPDKTISVYSLAYLIRAFENIITKHEFKDPQLKSNFIQKKNELFKELISRKKKDSLGVYFENESETYEWQGGILEISSLVLQTLMDIKDQSSLSSNLVTSIQKRLKGDSFTSTKETSAVILSLSRYFSKQKNISKKGIINFYLNSKKLTSIEYNSEDKKSNPSKVFPLDLNSSQYKIEANGKESSDVNFDVNIQGVIKLKSNNVKMKSFNSGFNLDREIFSLKRVKDVNQVEYLVPYKANTEKIQQGEELLIKLKITPDKKYEYILLEDYLASGFEVVKQDAFDGIKHYSHSEKRDDRMVYFINRLEKGKTIEIAYIIRAELNGEFSLKPAKIECMYSPEIRAYSEFNKIRVGE
jgi:hypothetical protein